jgi:curved DNA-binding protein CbpA
MYFVCCQILGVNPGADEVTIKTAYRKAAKELHPDHNASVKAQEYFVILTNAYDYLLKHPYSEAEIKVLWQEEQIRKRRSEAGSPQFRRQKIKKNRVENLSLREVLRESRTARTVYIAFHILFVLVGFLLIFHSIYDLFFHPRMVGTSFFSAYFTIIFGFFFGIVLTTTFMFNGISYIRNR